MMTFPEATRTVPGTRDSQDAPVTAPGASDREFHLQPASLRCRDHETLTARGWLSHYNQSWPNGHQSAQTVAITYGKARIRVMAKRLSNHQ